MTEQYRNKGKGSSHQGPGKGRRPTFQPVTIKAMVEGPMPKKRAEDRK
jgi:hypothetical protein